MTSNVTSSDRVWPKTGLWAASFRVMFPLAALWAVVCVGLWQWGQAIWPNLNLTVGWHIHEMTFGFGGAAVAGYLLTACSSWTGRAPVSGRPLAVLAGLWITARLGLVTGPWFASAIASALFFWWVAVLLTVEAKKGGKHWRPGFILFTLAAGSGSAIWISALGENTLPSWAPILPVFGFAFLLTAVAARMVPAFLQTAARRAKRGFRTIPKWEHPVLLGFLAVGVALLVSNYPVAAGLLVSAVGVGLLYQVGRWPLYPALTNSLLAMMVLGFLWLPAGLLMVGRSLILGQFSGPEAAHALIMGAMGGLIMAVSARAVAFRTPSGLKARRGTSIAFALIWLSVWARMFSALDLAATFWCAGWLLYLILFLPGLRGPVPRPVFSGARNI